MVNVKTKASTRFYMNQANKIVDVLSVIVPTIYCDVFKDDFDIFMDDLWEKPDEKYPAILDQSVLHVGESIESLKKIDWKSVSKEKQMEWLKRLDLQALLKALRFRPKALDYFCEKNSLVKEKMTNVLQSMINWRNYGVGHKSVYKYEQMDERVFKLNILEPVWDFYDLLSRKYQVECEILRKTLREIEVRMKYPETNVERLSQLSRKSEEMTRFALKTLNIYVDAEGRIKGENEDALVTNIKRLAKKDGRQDFVNDSREELTKKSNQKKFFVVGAILVLCLICIALGIHVFMSSADSNVPNVIGMNIQMAKKEIQDENLKADIKYVEKPGANKDEVIFQSKEPNTKTKKNSIIILKVCDGMIIVPGITGKRLDEAENILRTCHLKPNRTESYSNSVKKGCVVSQSVTEGEKAKENSLIDITVSKGKNKISVPNVEGKTYKQAKKKLKELGFKTKKVERYSASVKRNKVIDVNPSVGKKMKIGSKITLTVSKGNNSTITISDNTHNSSSKKSSNHTSRISNKTHRNSKKSKNTKAVTIDDFDVVD